MSQYIKPQIILLREGTDDSQGVGQIISNINSCEAVADIVATTLGPRGMDKLIVDQNKKVTISNDGATIMNLMDIVHPAAKTMVDIAKTQDSEVGDGTTSVVLLAASLMKVSKPYVEEGVHPQVIIRSYRRALEVAIARIREINVNVEGKDPREKRTLLERCAATAMSSKLIHGHKAFFSKMVVDAVQALDADLDMNMIGIKKVPGGALQDTQLVDGVAFKKTFSYAGFEQQPKRFENPKIVLLNVELELKAEKDNAEIRVTKPEEYQTIVDAEWRIIYEKLENVVKAGVQIVLSKLPIGDLATQFFADRNIFCAGRVGSDDLTRVARATGASVQTSIHNLVPGILGTCALFEERQVGGERYNFFSGCPLAKTATIIIRGGAEQFIEEAHRSLNDAIMVVRRATKAPAVVAGGGAIEMELSKFLREYALTIRGKQQLLINAYAKALEVIPKQLADNAGFDSTDILNKLRHAHATGNRWHGVDILNETIADNYEAFVWEPAMMKLNALTAATEAACMILSVDETIRNPNSQEGNQGKSMPQRGGMGGGRGGRRRR